MDTSDKILVTGAAGFMGSWICNALVEKGYAEVYGIDDLSGGDIENINIKSGGLNFYLNDLSDISKTNALIIDIKPDIIFHLAANAREGASFFQPLEIVKRNYLAYMNILEPAIKEGLDKIVLFSSMAVYGNGMEGKEKRTSISEPFYEFMERKPVDIYGINKTAMEQTTEILANVHDFRYTILRPHNVFGPSQSLSDPYRNVIGIFMNRIMRGEPIYIYGDGMQQRAFSYIEDSLDCYIKCVDDKYKTDEEIINIGGMKPITINILAETVCNKMGVGTSHHIKYLPERFGEVKNAFCSWEKSRKLLEYEEKIGWERGVEIMARWALKKGKQEWKNEKLSLWNERAPIIWK